MAQLSEKLARDAIAMIRTEKKLILTINEVDQALHGWIEANGQRSGESVVIPKNETQAEAMARMGLIWLEQHAPHRLKRSAPETSEGHDKYAGRADHEAAGWQPK